MTLRRPWNSSNRFLFKLGGLFSIPALVCFVVAGWLCADSWRFVRGAVRTEGTIVAVEEETGEGARYTPVFEFTDQSGRTHRVTSQVAAFSRMHSVGAKVPVLYNPDSPESARIEDFFALWGRASVALALGGVLFLPGFLIILAGFLARD